MGRPLFLGYLFLVHLILLLVLMNPNSGSWFASDNESQKQSDNFAFKHYVDRLSYQLEMEDTAPRGAVMLIGDSIAAGIDANSFSVPALNYGISGDTTEGVLFRYPLYQASLNSSVVVVSVGLNDLRTRTPNQIIRSYQQILEKISDKRPAVCVGVLPIDEKLVGSKHVTNDSIKRLNGQIRKICVQHPRSLFVDVSRKLSSSDGNLNKRFSKGDGVHLNTMGKMILVQALNKAVNEIQISGRAFNNPNIAFRKPSKLPPCDPTPVKCKK